MGVLVLNFGLGASDPVPDSPASVVDEKQIDRSSLTEASASVEFGRWALASRASCLSCAEVITFLREDKEN